MLYGLWAAFLEVIYVVGPLILVLRFGIHLSNISNNNFIEDWSFDLEEEVDDEIMALKVSILIPARNESHRISRLLDSLVVLHYSVHEVLVLDDHSDDGTREVCLSYADRLPIRVIHGQPLPHGWLGKPFACHQLSQAATGDYWLFMDADVFLYPDAIFRSVARAKVAKLDLLSIFPSQVMVGSESLVVPLMHQVLITLLPLKWVETKRNAAFAAANGQFMLFKADTYQAWHEKAKSEVVEDVAIARLIKKAGSRVGTYLTRRLVHCRMYEGYLEAIEGFAKNRLGLGNLAALWFYTVSVILWIPGMIHALEPGQYVYVFFILLIECYLVFHTIGSNGDKFYIVEDEKLPIRGGDIFFPSLLHIALLATYRSLTRSQQWKGRNVSA